jgi:hypothetical protein
VPNLSRAGTRGDASSSSTSLDGVQAVGQFGFGLLRNARPETLSTWRISARKPEVVARVGMLFGGMPWGDVDPDEYVWHVVIDTATVEVVLSGAHALRVRWRRDGCGRRCDGSDQGKEYCSCASLNLMDRKAAVRRGHGCVPNIEMSFRLSNDPALGLFTFTSGNWSFAEQAINAKAALGRLAVPTRIQLGLERTCHTLHRGRGVNYTKPTLALLGTLSPVPSGPGGDVTSATDGASLDQLAGLGRH